MNINISTLADAIDNQIALLQNNDVLDTEATLFLFSQKKGTSKYNDRELKKRLSIVASNIKSSGCNDRKYVTALVPCKNCGESIQVRLSFSNIITRSSLFKRTHSSLIIEQYEITERIHQQSFIWDCIHHDIHGENIFCQNCYNINIQAIINLVGSFYNEKEKTIRLLLDSPVEEIPKWWFTFISLTVCDSEICKISLKEGWSWEKQRNNRDSKKTIQIKGQCTKKIHEDVLIPQNTEDFYELYYTPIYLQTFKRRFLPQMEDHLRILAEHQNIDIQVIQKRASFMPYNDFLKTPLWRIVSSRIKFKKGKCEICGTPKNLEVHHKTYEHQGIEFLYPEDLRCLCHNCHNLEHLLMPRGKD